MWSIAMLTSSAFLIFEPYFLASGPAIFTKYSISCEVDSSLNNFLRSPRFMLFINFSALENFPIAIKYRAISRTYSRSSLVFAFFKLLDVLSPVILFIRFSVTLGVITRRNGVVFVYICGLPFLLNGLNFLYNLDVIIYVHIFLAPDHHNTAHVKPTQRIPDRYSFMERRHLLSPREDAVATRGTQSFELLANHLGVCSGEEMIGRFSEISRAWKLNEQMNEERYSIPRELHENHRRRRKKLYRTPQERNAAEIDERKERIKQIEEEIKKNREKMQEYEERKNKLRELQDLGFNIIEII